MNDAVKDERTVYVGRKPVLIYVNHTLNILEIYGEAKIKARGHVIYRAVDIAQIIAIKMYKGNEITNVSIGTESVKDSETGELKELNTMEIEIRRKN